MKNIFEEIYIVNFMEYIGYDGYLYYQNMIGFEDIGEQFYWDFDQIKYL